MMDGWIENVHMTFTDTSLFAQTNSQSTNYKKKQSPVFAGSR